MSSLQTILVPTAIALLLTTMGCGSGIRSLTTADPPRVDVDHVPLSFSVRVAEIETSGDIVRVDVPALRHEIAQTLRRGKLFDSVVESARATTETDFELRGRVEERWGGSGGKNFATYFPGGLAFAPAWRGTRWDLTLDSAWELLDLRTGETVGRYSVQTAHESVRTSGNPLHFFGSLLIVPGAFTASMRSFIRGRDILAIHEVAYPSLAGRLALQIDAEQRERLFGELGNRRASCGDRYDASPRIGDRWTRFLECQTHAFPHRGDRRTDSGPAAIYGDSTERWQVFVQDGQIVAVEDMRAIKQACGPRYAGLPRVGDAWPEFLQCQTRSFEPAGRSPERAADEPTQLFEDAAGKLRIAVESGRIVHWYETGHRPAWASAPSEAPE